MHTKFVGTHEEKKPHRRPKAQMGR